MTDGKNILSLEKVERNRFERNTIHQAFCELRFPTLPDLANVVPRPLLKQISRDFPHHEENVGLKIGITDRDMEQVQHPAHMFFSVDRTWKTWIRTSSLGVETTAYVDFEDFLLRVRKILDSAQPSLDTDFFTRVGLRYINVLPAEIDDIGEWVNNSLVGPLANGPLNGAQRCWSEVRGATELGTYTFRYGLVGVEGTGQRYVMDADFAVESVEWANTLSYLRRLNELNYYLYSWAIGPRTRQYLGTATKKGA